jgi:hypothetical protein
VAWASAHLERKPVPRTWGARNAFRFGAVLHFYMGALRLKAVLVAVFVVMLNAACVPAGQGVNFGTRVSPMANNLATKCAFWALIIVGAVITYYCSGFSLQDWIGRRRSLRQAKKPKPKHERNRE